MATSVIWMATTSEIITHMDIAERFEEEKRQLEERLAKFNKVDISKLKAERLKHEQAIESIDDEIAKATKELDLSPAPAKAKPGARRGGKRQRITIEDVKEAIRGGARNYREVAAELGCSSANVMTKIKKEGKATGISSTGERASFQLTLTGDQPPKPKEKGAKTKG